MTCSECGSYAINPHQHGRQQGVDLNLCDVCYWRKRATVKGQLLSTVEAAEYCGVSPAYLVELRQIQKGPAWIKMPGRGAGPKLIRYQISALDGWITQIREAGA